MGYHTTRLVISVFALFAVCSIGSSDLYGQASAGIVGQARSTCEKGYSATAVAALTELIAKEPANDDAYAVRAFCGARRDVKTFSQPDYAKALSLNPRNAFALTVRAFHKSVTDDSKGALADYDQALILDPKEEFAIVLRERLISENPKLIDPSVIDVKLAALKKKGGNKRSEL
jgi:tetratricopeptide (TPR) repeat protein